MLVHGDAAFAGQGIVAESLKMSELEAYTVGGTIHVIVNNQVGFTTSPHDARSTTYCTGPARMLQIPIIHVNGEDLEAVAQAVLLAVDFRQRFHRDVVIDLWTYRRHGHNEGDEPAFTQPVMYRAIARKPTLKQVLRRAARARGGRHGRRDVDAMTARYRAPLEQAYQESAALAVQRRRAGDGRLLEGLPRRAARRRTPRSATGVAARDAARRSARRSCHVPQGFRRPPEAREGARGPRRDGPRRAPARLGHRRGARARHARLGGDAHPARRARTPPRHLQPPPRGALRPRARHALHAALPPAQGQGPVEIRDSLLSEAAALGFEYGYASSMPEALAIWEAQFGDFVNAAQVIVDQFLSSGEAKWNRLSGLVLLLPARDGGAGAGALLARGWSGSSSSRWTTTGGS